MPFTVESLLAGDIDTVVAAAGTTVGLLGAKQLWSMMTVDDGSMDASIESWLEGKWESGAAPFYDEAPAGKHTKAIVAALEGMPFTEDPDECAMQMKSILRDRVLPYETLISEPEALLRTSSGNERQNGALWTRFTVSYNLYAGSIVALGSDEQRKKLVASQPEGNLGCFAFTECGCGVLSGAGVETTAIFDPSTDEFVIHSPTPSSKKNWISQGMYANDAVILAELIIGGEKKGPHLFWAHIADSQTGGGRGWLPGSPAASARPKPVKGVSVGSNPPKTCMHGLDNATLAFDNFRVPGSALLSRFCNVTNDDDSSKSGYTYEANLPANCKRMLDLLIFRLLTGRICLSEATMANAISRLRRNWQYCQQRELWRGRKEKGDMMAQMPLIRTFFRDYGRTAYIVSAFLAHTREGVARSIKDDHFTSDMVEATCMCKFVGTGFGLDLVDVVRKTMSARGLQADSWCGHDAFLPLACCAAEGDNTVMELKVVQDVVRGRTPKLPLALMARVAGTAQGRTAARVYMSKLANAVLLGVRALKAGQLLRDIAWARAHMRIIDVWVQTSRGDPEKLAWLDSYEAVLMKFPTPYKH